MRLDHIAYRVKNKAKAAEFFSKCLGYKLADIFDLKFDDGSSVECYALEPPEKRTSSVPFHFPELWFDWESEELGYCIDYHLAPEIFVSEGDSNSIVGKWVAENGSGVHHLAYEVTDITQAMNLWKSFGVEFASNEPKICVDEGLIQIFTKRHVFTNIVYELIQRSGKGFCRDNVKQLMESTK